MLLHQTVIAYKNCASK